ncbi:HipA family kinase [uncultured Roseibium sp.]|uniref:HipA family kinase n=1 Tax=uncultured Roseibium sp. TaxID=1936171 RepID=UPI0026315571|nr:HipA family kinase [uncultured Roseibium sp.]
MLELAIATEFVRPVLSGRTEPGLLICEDQAGESVDLFCKVSAGCDQGVSSLAREVVGACLAADLRLPIPRPYRVEISRDFAAVVTDDRFRTKLNNSSEIGFGSLKVPNQFAAWAKGNTIPDIMVPEAAAIFMFDAIIQNPDRRDGNPNCMVRGTDLRIFDHELAFNAGLIIGWVPPWNPGGLNWIDRPGAHIFLQGLKGRAIDYKPIKDCWSSLSDERILEYRDAVPNVWAGVGPAVDAALQLIRGARDNIDGCLNEMRRVLA